jgi:hypothetical protein
MKITVFGGTGETGLLVIQKALIKGHNVTAFARTPSKIPFQNDNLIIVNGELAEMDKIEKAVKGADVVISTLGPTTKTKGLVIAEGLRSIIDSMEKNGVKRLIVTATPSYKDPNDKFQLGFALGIFMIRNFLKDSYQNIVEIGKQISSSNLEWTLVRLPLLVSKPAKGKLNIGYTGDGKVKLISLTREDLADFLLNQLDDKTYIRKAPAISN